MSLSPLPLPLQPRPPRLIDMYWVCEVLMVKKNQHPTLPFRKFLLLCGQEAQMKLGRLRVRSQGLLRSKHWCVPLLCSAACQTFIRQHQNGSLCEMTKSAGTRTPPALSLPSSQTHALTFRKHFNTHFCTLTYSRAL